MATSPYPPARDPEAIPKPSFVKPDYDDPILDPDTGELPEDDDEEDPIIDEEDEEGPDIDEDDTDIDEEEDEDLDDKPLRT
jgi:hypothetical protein